MIHTSKMRHTISYSKAWTLKEQQTQSVKTAKNDGHTMGEHGPKVDVLRRVGVGKEK